MDKFEQLLNKKIVILDGAMGTMLFSSDLEIGQKPEMLNITKPESIVDIHLKYINAGADIIYTNTFGANRLKMKGYDYQLAIKKGVECAKIAVEKSKKDVLIGYDMGSVGELIEPMGSLTFDEAYDVYKEQVLLTKDDVDLYVLETMSDLYEVKAGILAIKENSNKPVIVTMSFDETGRTFAGCPVESFVATVEGLGVNALGMNCSVGPKQALNVVERLLSASSIPVICKPNAGLPFLKNGVSYYDIDEKQFVDTVVNFVKMGVNIVGGCCGTTDGYITSLNDALKNAKPNKITKKTITNVASGSRYVSIEKMAITGERINPTGKKLMKQAILDKNFSYFQSQAIEQVEAGAEILDINMGMPNIDEAYMMKEAVKCVQAVVDAPLQIDSSDITAIESGLRYCNGKAIVNSVNGDDDILNSILPIVKKYGALVIGLTLDKRGIPQTVNERLEIAKKILDRALFFGIPKQNVIIDCLTLTVGAEQKQAKNTLQAIYEVKNKLGLKTTLGVSNISFGLPQRELVNRTFLTLALANGLDLPIVNINLASIQEAIYSYRLLIGNDENGQNYIAKYSGETAVKTESATLTLKDCILKSLTEKGIELTKELLKTTNGLDIINEFVIPALDEIGSGYEKGKLFLPQLISCSEVAKSVCETVKCSMKAEESSNKCKILLATVEGDVHDIGKNIVKTVLQNYGYQVVDLGRDVECKSVAECVEKLKPQILGLSALMTTTVRNMAKTIKAVRDVDKGVIICVGGAVLNETVAEEIGADIYTKDPQQLVKFLQSKGL